MAPRKKKNKIHDEGEPSAAANKRRRIELLNSTTGVPFTNPFTQFPSIHLLHQHSRNSPRTTAAIDTDLQLSPPEPIAPDESATADDHLLSSLVGQQNFLIGYHINQMMLSVEEFWRRNFAEEVKKRKEIEEKIKVKDEQAVRFRQMYHFYEERTFLLEDMLQRRVAGEGCSTAAAAAAVPEEQVESCFVDLNSVPRKDMACRNCRSRPATMLWLPCRHLCVCLVCERRVKICPICSVQKTESLMVNFPPP
ncbi:probable BOI-related E3 ubiquitin-protein ligase 3 [Lactuca sativa]|uniref:probable BOI-related E3 ubiquitin-protein ligase 3 n=1 Tax=Lactuca sativa TaxID=4236 RepID=UPI000CC7287B|nr:probable BOI-related E3 ubiquitin-protein ligase 3 [Lactuca sativa]